MKILDKYILKSFLKPFLATFLVVMFVLVMQFLWIAFDQIAGKGIDIIYILKFLGYTCLNVTPTALPIGVLLSSIMALGNISENYEMAAVRSAGITLKRFITPLVFLTIIISGINFIFLNNIYPYASLKQRNLLLNMRKQKPALALIEGSFNTDIPGYSIKFEKKYGPEENLLKDVMILDLKNSKKNDKIITADHGEITTKDGSKYMTLKLYDGYYFEDHTDQKKRKENRDKMPSSLAKFDTYKVNIDISSFNNNNLDTEKYKQHFTMLSVKQLYKQSDSLKGNYDAYLNSKATNFYNRNNARELVKPHDSLLAKGLNKNILENFDLKSKITLLRAAKNNAKTPLRTIGVYKENFKNKRKILNLFDFEFHYRLAFSLSCLVLFFIGAPLGSLIRKGGLGMPMILAILVFVVYFFINSLGRNIAEESSISAIFGGWLSTLILLPCGIYLTYRAGKGRGFANMDKITVPIKNFFKRFKKQKTTI